MDYWGDTTNPLQHDDANYRYLVRTWALRDPLEFTKPRNKTGEASNDDEKRVLGKYEGETLVDLLSRPHEAFMQQIVAHSIVDPQSQHRCMNTFGIITKIPRANMIGAWAKDMLTKRKDLYKLDKWRENFVDCPADPTEVLARTKARPPGSHGDENNEILAVGTYEGSRIETQAVFYLEDPFGRPYDPFLVSLLKKNAAVHGLEMVVLKHRCNGELVVDIDRDDRFVATLDGVSYEISETGSRVWGIPLRDRLMSRAQFAGLRSHLSKAGLSRDRIDELESMWQRSVQFSHAPHFVFDKDGNVEGLLKTDGDEQHILHAITSDACRSMNADVVYDSRRAKEHCLEWSIDAMDYRQPVALTEEQVRQMAEAAMAALDATGQAAAAKWWAGRRHAAEPIAVEWLARHEAVSLLSLAKKSDRVILQWWLQAV